ncbi:MAG: hypothetical protein AB8G23_02310 [Myxococcota bacterium]
MSHRLIFSAALLSLLTSIPASGAETIQVPLSVIPGSVVWRPAGPTEDRPAELPFAENAWTDDPDCDDATATARVEARDGGLDVRWEPRIIATPTSSGSCFLDMKLDLDIELVVPDFGEASTMMFSIRDRVEDAFESPDATANVYVIPDPAVSEALEGTRVSLLQAFPSLSPKQSDDTSLSVETKFIHGIPGDRLRTTLTLSFSAAHRRLGGEPTVGVLAARYELRAIKPTVKPAKMKNRVRKKAWRNRPGAWQRLLNRKQR